MAYAEGTAVAFEKSIAEMITLIKKAGGQNIGQMESDAMFAIQFFMSDRLIRFRVRLPAWQEMPERNGRREHLDETKRRDMAHKASRQRGRALLLVIKAKLESVESEVETFEQAFLANVVMADGQTLYERVAAPIALEYQTGQVQSDVLMIGGPQ